MIRIRARRFVWAKKIQILDSWKVAEFALQHDELNLKVLCVSFEIEEIPAELETRIRQADVDLQQRRDVYSAMALIGRWKPNLVIIAVDWLIEDQLEILDWIAKVSPNTRTCVTGFENRVGPNYTAAIGRGANPLTPEVFSSLPIRPTPDNQEGQTGASPSGYETISDDVEFAPQADVLDSLIDSAAEPAGNIGSISQETTRVEDADEAFIEASATDVFDEDAVLPVDDDSSQPVRVPWLRYDSTTRRKPPVPRATIDETEIEPESATVNDDPPLLSREELDALLGDGPVE